MSSAIEEVKARHAPRLLALPGVISIGISVDPAGQPIIVIGLDGPRPETRRQLPPWLDGYPVRVEIIDPSQTR